MTRIRHSFGIIGFSFISASLVLGVVVPGISPSAARGYEGEVIDPLQLTDTNGCMGTRTTPGSENTTLTLLDGDLRPGGWVLYELRFPVGDASGREAFVVQDCVIINNRPVEQYAISIAPNEFFVVYRLDIPESAAWGGEYCNYAKTTAAVSDSQGSNRKAASTCLTLESAPETQEPPVEPGDGKGTDPVDPGTGSDPDPDTDADTGTDAGTDPGAGTPKGDEPADPDDGTPPSNETDPDAGDGGTDSGTVGESDPPSGGTDAGDEDGDGDTSGPSDEPTAPSGPGDTTDGAGTETGTGDQTDAGNGAPDTGGAVESPPASPPADSTGSDPADGGNLPGGSVPSGDPEPVDSGTDEPSAGGEGDGGTTDGTGTDVTTGGGVPPSGDAGAGGVLPSVVDPIVSTPEITITPIDSSPRDSVSTGGSEPSTPPTVVEQPGEPGGGDAVTVEPPLNGTPVTSTPEVSAPPAPNQPRAEGNDLSEPERSVPTVTLQSPPARPSADPVAPRLPDTAASDRIAALRFDPIGWIGLLVTWIGLLGAFKASRDERNPER